MNEGKIKKPTNPKEWADLSMIGREGMVGQGHWSAMDQTIFRKRTDEFQCIMQAKLDRGMERVISFSAQSS